MNTNVLKTSKIYKKSGKFDDHQQFKYILETAMVYTPDYYPTTVLYLPGHHRQSKKLSARKSLCMFTNVLEVKKMIFVKLELLNLSER